MWLIFVLVVNSSIHWWFQNQYEHVIKTGGLVPSQFTYQSLMLGWFPSQWCANHSFSMERVQFNYTNGLYFIEPSDLFHSGIYPESVHTHTHYFFKIHFKINLPSTPSYSEFALLLIFSDHNSVCLSCVLHLCYILSPSRPKVFNMIQPDILWICWLYSLLQLPYFFITAKKNVMCPRIFCSSKQNKCF